MIMRPGQFQRLAARGDQILKEAATARSINEEALLREYYEILKIVGEFDGRLMTVKGWGVTLSLAALAWGVPIQPLRAFSCRIAQWSCLLAH